MSQGSQGYEELENIDDAPLDITNVSLCVVDAVPKLAKLVALLVIYFLFLYLWIMFNHYAFTIPMRLGPCRVNDTFAMITTDVVTCGGDMWVSLVLMPVEMMVLVLVLGICEICRLRYNTFVKKQRKKINVAL